jgi:DEAD/DEAH box helicase domain-containing protein
MFEFAQSLVHSCNLDVVETLELPFREERRSMPVELARGPLSTFVIDSIASDTTAWIHQSLALQKLFAGDNVVVATGTASGKSLIFQLYAFHRILEDREAKVLIFYPLKALSSDQFQRWQKIATKIGIKEDDIVRIDGDMKLTVERDEAIEHARIILMTPDVCQAWLMRNVGSSRVRQFLDRLCLLVLDEAHIYESVFGSNVAFLLRRLIAARRRALRAAHRDFQVIASTATITDPADHLARLTGLTYHVIEEPDNGAPQRPRLILHVNGAEYGAAAESGLRTFAEGILDLPSRHRFLFFLDSRQGVERTARGIDKHGVLPYRSGYEPQDRRRIETALRNGSLSGVVATSALELGIDIADMDIGVNVGVPQSRKSFRQRAGRIGRTSPGIFLIMAGKNAFKKFGETFKDYYEGSVEPSYLYLGNRFIQFARARCLFDEMEVLGGDRSALPVGVKWPDGFDEVLRYAKPGVGHPRDFDLMAQIGGDNPHFNYPLRQIGEASFILKEGGRDIATRLGTIATNQAIREAYPGANYLHLGRAYKVLEWSTRAYDRSIRLAAAQNVVPTRPILRRTVTLDLSADGIVDQRIKRCPTGLVAEVHLQVNESVEGYTIGSKSYLYRDIRSENPNMSRKQRDFRTTGVLVKIEESWFDGADPKNRHIRARVCEGLLGIISRDRSIAPQDIDATSTNIALLTESGPRRLTDAVVVYDSVYGGLRLTEELFSNFEGYITQLGRAADLAGSDAIVTDEIAERLKRWSAGLCFGEAAVRGLFLVPDGFLQVYKPGSVVSIFLNGVLSHRELIEPKFIDPFETGTKQLFYSYKNDRGVGYIPHNQVQPTGQDWSWTLWNPETKEYQELDDESTSAPTEGAEHGLLT